MKAATQIFLSYAREDEEKVERFYQKLSSIGFKPWMDKKDILPGERWQSSIRRAIQHSDFFLACLSANSLKRGFLQKEIKHALDIWQEMFEDDIYLIPVRLEDCEVPEILRDFQWVDLFEEDGWTRLVKAIQVGIQRRAEVPADEKLSLSTEMATPEKSPKRIHSGYEDLIPEQFADREDERLLIQHRVEAAQTGEIEYPLVEFYGVAGQGKSWLVSYLVHQYWLSNNGRGPSLQKPTFSAKIDFGVLRTLPHSYPLLQSLTAQIREQLTGAEPELRLPRSLEKDAPPLGKVDVVAKELAEFVTGLTDHYVPILAFDATDKADEEMLDWLEQQIVYPIIHTNRAIFIFSGRLWHRWKIFEVRRRVEPVGLFPLDRKREEVKGTAELLTKLGVERAETVARTLYDYAFGHPLASKVIFKELQRLVPRRIDEYTLEKNWDAIVEIVKDKVIENRFFDELGQHNYLEPLLWGVCILRKFNSTTLRHFTVSSIDGEYEQESSGYYMDAIRDMQDTTLVQWSSAAGGYTLDPVVRKIMAKNLSMRDPAEFQRRHQETVKLYDNWIENFPRNAVGFLIERTFHRNWALRDGKTQREIEDTLVSEFDRILKDVEKHPDVQWDLPDLAVALNEELAKDEELKEVISEDAFERLMECAERLREKFRGAWS